MNKEYLPIFVLSWWYPWFGTSKHRKHVLFMSRILGHNCRTVLHCRLWLGDGRRNMVTTSNGRGCVYTKTTTTTNNKGKKIKYNNNYKETHRHTQTTLLFRYNRTAAVKTNGYFALGNYQYCFSCDFKYLKPWTIQLIPLSATTSTNTRIAPEIWHSFPQIQQQVTSKFQKPSLSKWGQVHNLSCENDFYLRQNEK